MSNSLYKICRLKSGSVDMIITAVYPADNKVKVTWYNSVSGEINTSLLPFEVINIIR